MAGLVVGAVLVFGVQRQLATASDRPERSARQETSGEAALSEPGEAETERPDWPSTARPSPTTAPAAPSTAPAPASAPAPPPPAADPGLPSPGRVFVAGDSVTVQAMVTHGPGEGAPADLQTSAYMGWTAADVQPQLDSAMAAAPPDTLVVALGLNDSSTTMGGDGWSEADALRFRGMLATPEPRACVVVVLPGHGPAVDPRYAEELAEARLALLEMASERAETWATGPTVVVDWQAEVDARPWLLDRDGIHLATDPVTGSISAEAAAARTGLYWAGVRQCQGGGGTGG